MKGALDPPLEEHLKNSERIFMIDPDNKIILSVFDSGVGIKKKNQSQLFKMFGRISAT